MLATKLKLVTESAEVGWQQAMLINKDARNIDCVLGFGRGQRGLKKKKMTYSRLRKY